MFKEYHRQKLLLMLLDVLLLVGILLLTIELRPYLPGKTIHEAGTFPGIDFFLIVALLWHGLFASTGVYEYHRIPVFGKQISRFTQAHIIAVFAFAGLLYFTYRDVSRMLVIYFSVGAYLAMFLARFLLHVYTKDMNGFFGDSRMLIVGTCEGAVRLAETIKKDHGSVVEICGFAEDGGCSLPEQLPAPLLGALSDVSRVVRERDINIVMIALMEDQSERVQELIYELESLPVRVYLVPDMLRLALVQAEVEVFGDLVAIGIREPVIQGHRRVFKRIMDLMFTIFILFFIWPLLLLVAFAIRIDSPGPALFIARRVGENGKLFNMFKFRTMVIGAETLQQEIVSYDEQNRPIYKIKNDPRVTKLGRFLRRTSMDELPQLFNVLKGDMSLVGPRPEQPFITAEYDHWQWRRLSVPPGITGWWQVSGRSDLAMHLNSQYDLYYVRNYSFFLDLKILFKTIGTVIRGKGAY